VLDAASEAHVKKDHVKAFMKEAGKL